MFASASAGKGETLTGTRIGYRFKADLVKAGFFRDRVSGLVDVLLHAIVAEYVKACVRVVAVVVGNEKTRKSCRFLPLSQAGRGPNERGLRERKLAAMSPFGNTTHAAFVVPLPPSCRCMLACVLHAAACRCFCCEEPLLCLRVCVVRTYICNCLRTIIAWWSVLSLGVVATFSFVVHY